MAKATLEIGIDKGLLIDPTHALDVADIVCVLGTEISRMLGFELAERFELLALTLHGDQLGFCADQPVLYHLCIQCLKALGKNLQVVPLPNATYSAGGYKYPFPAQFVGHPNLSKGWVLVGKLHHRLLYVQLHPVFQDGLATADLL